MQQHVYSSQPCRHQIQLGRSWVPRLALWWQWPGTLGHSWTLSYHNNPTGVAQWTPKWLTNISQITGAMARENNGPLSKNPYPYHNHNEYQFTSIFTHSPPTTSSGRAGVQSKAKTKSCLPYCSVLWKPHGRPQPPSSLLYTECCPSHKVIV